MLHLIYNNFVKFLAETILDPYLVTEFSNPRNPKMCDPILVTLLRMQPIIVNPVVKMRPHPAAHRHLPHIWKYAPHFCFGARTTTYNRHTTNQGIEQYNGPVHRTNIKRRFQAQEERVAPVTNRYRNYQLCKTTQIDNQTFNDF